MEHYTRSREIRRKLADVDPQNAQSQHDLVVSQFKLGSVERQRFAYAAAIDHFENGIVVLRKLVQDAQLGAQSKRDLHVMESAVDFCRSVPIATASLDEVLSQSADQILKLLSVRMTELARKGELAALALTADKLREFAAGDPNSIYDAACGYSMCICVIETPPMNGIFLSDSGQSRDLSVDEMAARKTHVDPRRRLSKRRSRLDIRIC